jgi:hypothetical protein
MKISLLLLSSLVIANVEGRTHRTLQSADLIAVAVEACKNVKESDRAACIQDIEATGDVLDAVEKFPGAGIRRQLRQKL